MSCSFNTIKDLLIMLSFCSLTLFWLAFWGSEKLEKTYAGNLTFGMKVAQNKGSKKIMLNNQNNQ